MNSAKPNDGARRRWRTGLFLVAVTALISACVTTLWMTAYDQTQVDHLRSEHQRERRPVSGTPRDRGAIEMSHFESDSARADVPVQPRQP